MSAIEPLLDLQEIDSRIRSLEQEIKDIPQRKAQENARLDGARTAVEAARKDVKDAEGRVSNEELEVKTLKDKTLQLKQNQAQLKTNKEFQAYNLEIDHVQQDVDNHEARVVAALDAVSPKKETLTVLEAKLKDEQGVVDNYLKQLDERLAAVQKELAEVQATRKEAAAKCSVRGLLIYERLKTRRWPVIVELQEDGVCKGCNLVQPPAVVQQVRHNQELVTCQICGRILHM